VHGRGEQRAPRDASVGTRERLQMGLGDMCVRGAGRECCAAELGARERLPRVMRLERFQSQKLRASRERNLKRLAKLTPTIDVGLPFACGSQIKDADSLRQDNATALIGLDRTTRQLCLSIFCWIAQFDTFVEFLHTPRRPHCGVAPVPADTTNGAHV